MILFSFHLYYSFTLSMILFSFHLYYSVYFIYDFIPFPFILQLLLYL